MTEYTTSWIGAVTHLKRLAAVINRHTNVMWYCTECYTGIFFSLDFLQGGQGSQAEQTTEIRLQSGPKLTGAPEDFSSTTVRGELFIAETICIEWEMYRSPVSDLVLVISKKADFGVFNGLYSLQTTTLLLTTEYLSASLCLWETENYFQGNLLSPLPRVLLQLKPWPCSHPSHCSDHVSRWKVWCLLTITAEHLLYYTSRWIYLKDIFAYCATVDSGQWWLVPW